MARATKAECFTVILAEVAEHERAIFEGILEDCWLAMGLDYYPAGMDYLMLHMSVQSGWSRVEVWLSTLLNLSYEEKFWLMAIERLRHYPDLEVLIDGLLLCHLRYLRASTDNVSVKGQLAARSRAIKMLGRTAAEVAA